MITIKKTFGVQGAANDMTLIKIQEIIAEFKETTPCGKVVIDSEQITFYKFGLKVGRARLAPNGLVVNEQGIIKYTGYVSPEFIPIIKDKLLLKDIYILFNARWPF